MLEDREADAELVIHALQAAGFEPDVTRVDNREAYAAALDPGLDLVLADYNMPAFDALTALDMLNESGYDLPFIIVSGSIGEDVAVEAIHRGAADYLLKDRLTRLPSAIAQALEKKNLREENRRADRALRESQERFERVFAEGAVGMALVGEDYHFIDVNEALCQMLGYEKSELLGLSVQDITHPDDYTVAANLSKQMFAGQVNGYRVEKRYMKRTGEEVWVQLSVSLVRDHKGAPMYSIGVIQDITERRRAEQDLQFMALHDTLTELPNRTLFADRLQQAILSANREGGSFGLMVMDMDSFKEVNDSLGHQSGDLLLKQMSSRLTAILRESDTVARLGGDEFGVLPTGTINADLTQLTARKILSAMQTPFEIGEAAIETGLSIGIAQFPDHGRDAETLMRRADVAMYVAKRNKTGCAVYSAEQDEHSAGRLALMGEMRQAIRSDQLELHYQPKVDVKTRTTFGVEALVRWRHPVRGLLPPDQFIPLAEQSDLMSSLARWVLTEAIAQVQAWRKGGIELSMAVNLSAANLHEASLPELIGDLLTSYDVDPSVLTVEITESGIMVAQADRTVRRLSDMGVRVSIDDFGTGYSALSYLKALPVDEIKIDRSFVHDMANNPDDAAIVQPTIDLGHNLRLHVIAEGVENEETWRLLDSLGCDSAQGFLVSPALPAGELETWLRASEWGGARNAEKPAARVGHGARVR
ncbi:MAG: hypothetical protein QOE92_1652 [Chloroflexota bacterium]|jgi:diguanylate cyclase (GGDEF)-like protein/PAS domain S-box-containing protein|nr:hypothetical protein [Chloroflexota bacterium]